MLMSEITKLYENAGIEKCSNNLKKYKPDVCLLNDNIYGRTCNDCMWYHYPPFTAQKQIEICKFLLKVEHSISYYFYENRYGFVIDDKQDDYIEAEKFETALAMIVNNLWHFLTEEEKQQVKGILE